MLEARPKRTKPSEFRKAVESRSYRGLDLQAVLSTSARRVGEATRVHSFQTGELTFKGGEGVGAGPAGGTPASDGQSPP
jgi:hypothetical protein